MSSKESNVSNSGSGDIEYDEEKTTFLYCTLKNVSTGSCSYTVN
jgi:hypothetical protein